jgi:hypothetical protein
MYYFVAALSKNVKLNFFRVRAELFFIFSETPTVFIISFFYKHQA